MEVGASFQASGLTPMLRARRFTPCMSQGACLSTILSTRRVCSGCCAINSQTVRGSHRHAPCRFSRTRSRASRTAGINSPRMLRRAGQRWHYCLRCRTSLTRAIDLVERVIYIPPGGPPQGPPPNSAIYRTMGEANIFMMMRDFYKELEKSELRPLFPADLEQASKKSAEFFVTILGGPPLYAQKYGPPRMRARHIPFEIDERRRQIWLGCFDRVLEDADVKYVFPMEYMEGFKTFLKNFSAWMVNTKGGQSL